MPTFKRMTGEEFIKHYRNVHSLTPAVFEFNPNIAWTTVMHLDQVMVKPYSMYIPLVAQAYINFDQSVRASIKNNQHVNIASMPEYHKMSSVRYHIPVGTMIQYEPYINLNQAVISNSVLWLFTSPLYNDVNIHISKFTKWWNERPGVLNRNFCLVGFVIVPPPM